jgi:hypothetical protein
MANPPYSDLRKVGIRPAIGDRFGGVRQLFEDPTLAMAGAVARAEKFRKEPSRKD